MHINVLGPFEVIREGAVLTPSAPKLRQVFAMLALQANRVVRTDQLIEELWEDRPPLSATTTLQTYVYQLRKLLASSATDARPGDDRPDHGVVLRTTPGGYMLGLPDNVLDAHLFEELAEQGRLSLNAGDYEAASATLVKAQSLWRGRPLTAVDAGPALQIQAVRLEELHKVVVEQRIDADLHLGRHLDVIGELRTLVSQQPTHEGFQAKLMLALYRAHRRSEALVAFKRARAVLHDELGLEPSADLQRLHRAILNAAPAVEASTFATRLDHARPAHPPSQLPPDLPQLRGQEAQLRHVHQALTVPDRSAPPVALVIGAPAAGKTAFAVHAGHQLRAEFPDGQLYAPLTTTDGVPVEPSRVLAGFLAALGVAVNRIPHAVEERVQLFRTWTATRRILVVLDDVTDAAQLGLLLPSGTGCATIATSRRRTAHQSITVTTMLERLTPQASRDLLVDAVGVQRTEADPEALHRLVGFCDGLPGALRAVTSALQMRPHWSLRRILETAVTEPERLVAFLPQPILTQSLSRTARSMPSQTWSAFRTLAALATGPISPAEAAEILGCGEITAEAFLEDLVVYQLAEIEDVAPGGDTCRFHYQLRRPLVAAARMLHPTDPHAPEQERGAGPCPAAGGSAEAGSGETSPLGVATVPIPVRARA